jgi:transcriptional antiterminator NusG
MAEEAKWYVVHTLTGYENKVKANLEKSVESRGIQNLIQEVTIPTMQIVEEKENKQQVTKTKIAMPTYVIVKMIMTDESWYVVRNTRGVTGFVGPGSKPVPLKDDEIARWGIEIVQDAEIKAQEGDRVSVVSGQFEGFEGVIESIDKENRKINVRVSMFGRDTLVEGLKYNQIKVAD